MSDAGGIARLAAGRALARRLLNADAEDLAMLTCLLIGCLLSALASAYFFARGRTAWTRTPYVAEVVRDMVCKHADEELAALAAEKPVVLLDAGAREARYGVMVKTKARRLTAGATVKRLDSGDFAVSLRLRVTELGKREASA